MPKVSNYTRTRIELLHKHDLHPAEIFKLLNGEGLLTWPLTEPHTGTTWSKTLQLLRSLSYSTGNAQGSLVPSLPLLLTQAVRKTNNLHLGRFRVFPSSERLTFPLHDMATDGVSMPQAT